MIFDSGKHWLIDKRNAKVKPLGWLNFNRALAKSDNVYFYEMGNRVGIEISINMPLFRHWRKDWY